MAVISIVILISRPSKQMARKLEVPTLSGCSPSHNRSLASALICPLYFQKKYSSKICTAVLCSFTTVVSYEESTCQPLCVLAGAKVMVPVTQLLLRYWYWHGHHLIFLIK